MARAWLVLGAAVIFAAAAQAYVLYDHSWPSATTTFNVDIAGADGKWNTSFEQAMGRWNAATLFEFRIRRDTFENPCDGLPTGTSDGDFENGVAFASDACGEAFGDNVVAVNQWWSQGTRALQSNIHFNDAYSWNVYDGPYKTGQWAGIEDFRRVAVHELGHALGLGHEDDVPAIMATSLSRGDTLIGPQPDDIAGVAALYSGGPLPSAPVLVSPSDGAAGVSLTPRLDWRASANADAYDVHFGTSSNPSLAQNLVRLSYRPGPLATHTTYYWRVVARNASGTSSSATYRFTTMDLRPANDLFSNARPIAGPSGMTTGSNVGATGETNEPGAGSKSVWWQWRAPGSGTVTIDTVGSSFDTTLGVYTGTQVNALTLVAENDDADGLDLQSRVTLSVTAGTAYWLRVASFDGSEGSIVLNWNLEEEAEEVSHKHIFPQFPFGGGWESTLMLQALDGDTTCTFSAQDRFLTMQRSSGETYTGTELSFFLPGMNDWRILKTAAPPVSVVSSGMAVLDCNKEVSANTLFSLEVGGSVVAEALVEPSEEVVASGEFAVFLADHRDNARFGMAVANPSNEPLDVFVTVGDTKGQVVVDTATVRIPANSSKAFFVDELGTIPPGHSGQVLIWSAESVYVVGLRFTGVVFTTIPATVRSF